MCAPSIKVPMRKKSGKLSYAPRIYSSRKENVYINAFHKNKLKHSLIQDWNLKRSQLRMSEYFSII